MRATGEDHPGAAAGQLERGVVAEAPERGAGDQHGAAGLVRDVLEPPDVGVAAHGVTANESRMRRAERFVAGDLHRARVRVASAAGEDDERLALQAQAHRRVGGDRRAAARRGRRRSRRTPPAGWPPTSSTAVVPAGAPTRLARTTPEALGEVRRGVPRAGRVHAAGQVDRAADVLLVHPHVERTVAQQPLPVPGDAAEDPLRSRRRRRSAGRPAARCAARSRPRGSR